MKRIFPAIALLVSCNVTDDRPETLAYITETILEPACGTAECHSAMKAEYGYVFDSVDAARTSLQPIVITCPEPPCTTAPAGSFFLTVITQQDSKGNRMPLDAPLANKDIVLIEQWLLDGSPGLEAP